MDRRSANLFRHRQIYAADRPELDVARSLKNSPRLPFRRLLLMPWRWERWSQVAAVVFLLGSFPAYILSLPVAEIIAIEFGFSDGTLQVLRMFYTLAIWCAENVPMIGSLWNAEFELIQEFWMYWNPQDVTCGAAAVFGSSVFTHGANRTKSSGSQGRAGILSLPEHSRLACV